MGRGGKISIAIILIAAVCVIGYYTFLKKKMDQDAADEALYKRLVSIFLSTEANDIGWVLSNMDNPPALNDWAKLNGRVTKAGTFLQIVANAYEGGKGAAAWKSYDSWKLFNDTWLQAKNEATLQKYTS